MLNIIFKAILFYILFRIAKGIYNAYKLSKKIRGTWTQRANTSSPDQRPKTFEAEFRQLNDDD